MAIDFERTVQLIRGSLFEEATTWPEYAAQRVPLKDTLLLITLPAVVGSALIAFILNLIFGKLYVFGGGGVGGLFAGIIGGLLGVAIWAAAAYFFAGLFKSNAAPEAEVDAENPSELGTSDAAAASTSDSTATFDQAFAAVSFGFLPGFVGMILGSLPWIGVLLLLIASVYALMTLYRALPIFLPIAPDNRIKHFVATFLAALIASMVLSTVLSGLFVGSQMEQSRSQIERNIDALEADLENAENEPNVPDMFGVGSQVDYMEAAAADEYDPPGNGKLSEKQVEQTVLFLQRTETLRERAGAKLKRMADDADAETATPSLGDLFKGIRGAVTVGTAEMQVVKAGSGNWAEHQWVKQQLYQAQLLQDQDATSEHNYELYLEHEEALDALL
ncbi:MAG: YIP1 family protein [Pseudomonadales bacterium]